MPQKILHLYKDYYPPVRGGIEQTINLMANGQKDEFDVSVLVCCGHEVPGIYDINGIRVIRAPEIGRYSSAPLSPGFVKSLDKELQSVDLVHLHHPNPTSDIALAITGLHGKKAVMTYHSDIIRQRFSKFVVSPFLHMSMRQCSVIMPTSPDYIESSSVLKRFRSKLEVVPLGIELEHFAPSPASNIHTKEYKAMARSRKIISFNGRLRYYKGLPYAINAMSNVDNAIFLIAGDGSIRRDLEDLVTERNLTDRIIFLGDVSHDELVGLLHASDIFCMPSHLRSEALGISMIEAMSCGLPIVSCDVKSGVRFVNPHEETGLRVQPADADALANALNTLIASDNMRLSYGTAARDRAKTIFSAQQMNRHLREVYHKVLSK